MGKLIAPSIAGARRLRTMQVHGKRVAEGVPVPVDVDGNPPRLWGETVGYVIAEDPAFDADDQALVDAVDEDEWQPRRGKPRLLRAGDNTEAKVRARLAARIAVKKQERADRAKARPVR